MDREKFLQAQALNEEINLLQSRAASYQQSIDSISDPAHSHTADSVQKILKMYLSYPDFCSFAIDWLKAQQLETESRAAGLRNINVMLEAILITASILLHLCSGFIMYWLYQEKKDLHLTIDFFVQKIDQLADITAANAGKTKLSLALRFEDLQTAIATVYADCIMYLNMKKRLNTNYKRYEQTPNKAAGNSSKISGTGNSYRS